MSDSRIHSLDGLRALAITLVILAHLHSGHSIRALDYLWRFELLGDMGVRVFFVISGFLITTLLRSEYRRQGRIDLKGFYLRRALRIWPAFYAFLTVVAIGALLGRQDVGVSGMAGAALMLSNYLPTPRVIAHTWSLAVEEQFYLLWPLLLVGLGWRRSIWLVLLFCLAAPVLRLLVATSLSSPPILWPRFEHAGDAIGWGCLYAIAVEGRRLPPLPSRRAAGLALLAFAGLIGLSACGGWPLWWAGMGTLLANLLVLLMLHGALHARGTWVHWALNCAAVRRIGVLSYSLYLWQQVFVYGGFKLAAPWNVLAMVLAASASYAFIEQPFLRLKSRLAARSRTAGAAPAGETGLT